MGVCQSINKPHTKSKNKQSYQRSIEKNSHYADKEKLQMPEFQKEKKSFEEPTCDHNMNSNDSCNSNNSVINKIILFSIEASPFEKETLVYTKKGNRFSFTSIEGQWLFIPEYGMTSYEGYEQAKHNNKNLCCLLFRILGGKTQQVELNKIYTAETTGPIQFFPNIDINEAKSYLAKGFFNVTMKGIEESSLAQIDQMMGWKQLHYSSADYLIDIEKAMINYINKLRLFPKKFADLYLKDNYWADSYFEICSFLMELTSMPQLDNDICLTKAAKAHAKDIGTYGLTGHQGTDSSNVKERIERYSNKGSKINYFGENCFFGLNDPLSLVLNMLLDECSTNKANRFNILNPSYTHLGISIKEHYSFKWCCVIVFTGNDN